jgi:signal transduction histidine kinase
VNRTRGRLAAGLGLVVVAIALVVTLAGFWLAARAGTPPRPIVTRVDQVGDRVAVVQVDGVGNDAAAHASRVAALRWVLVALAGATVPIAGLAWVASGWLLRSRVAAGEDATPAEPLPAPPPPVPVGDRERRRHLQDVAHELRTPLAVTATNLDLAATSPRLDDEVAARLAAARRGVERMARTVDDLSAHGRLAPAVETGAVDLMAEIGLLAAEQAGPARVHRVSLAVRGPERLEVRADEQAVRTAVGNLLANAVRLAPAGSVIELVCGTREDWAWIAVRDEGPGLPPEDHERAFRRYWRGRYETDREPGGPHSDTTPRGLGLTIARQVTEAQGGHVTLRSTVGVGSTFVVWLPRSPEARTERVVADDGVHHRVDPLAAEEAAIGAASQGVLSAT